LRDTVIEPSRGKIMTGRTPFLLLFFGMLAFLPGCEIILGIFKAGFWTAIILVILVIGLAIFGYKKYQDNK
jgi:hypothetical protein